MATEKRPDLVEREAIKDAIGFMNLHFLGHGENKSVLDSINEVPSVDAVEVVHGRWVDSYGGKYANPRYVCSECKEKALYKFEDDELHIGLWVQELTDYCPNCGAKMNGEKV